jgi:NADPH:quinone reductase-like Zn-dependent oxidoreductase
MMKAYILSPDQDAYRLELVERPVVEPGPGQVRIRVHATSLNYRDHINLKNLAKRKVAGRIPLSDGAGEITAVSDGSVWKVGDRVAGCFFQSWQSGRFQMAHHKQDLGGTLDGMLAEEVILSSDGVISIPDYLSYEEAACLPCAALTTWHALLRGGFQGGDTLLALGTGGVSVFALQFASALGGEVIITSSSDDKLSRAKALGATHTINYKTTPDWEKEVYALTNQQGVDHVIEVGGPGTLAKSLASVAPGGHIAQIGVLTGFGAADTSLFPIVSKNATISGIYVGSREQFIAMNQFLIQKQIRPVIDRIFSFGEAKAAYDYLASGNHFGKIVIRMD